MLSEDTDILQFNQYPKPDKAPFLIYVDLEFLIEKIDGRKNNLENSSTSKVGEHIPLCFSMPTKSSFQSIDNKYNVYGGKDCTKKNCEPLREHAMKVIKFKKKKMKLLTKERQEYHKNAKILYKKRLYKNNKFKISAPKWNEECELPDGSYSTLYIQDYFEYILQKHGEETDNASLRIYVNKIENRIKFRIKTGYYLELLMPGTMKFFQSTKSKITKDKNGEDVPHLETTR